MVRAWEKKRVGKFWLNPKVEIRDLEKVLLSGSNVQTATLLILLHDTIKRTPIPLENNLRLRLETWLLRCGIPDHPIFDDSNVRYCLRTEWNGSLPLAEMVCSVSEWAMKDDPQLSSHVIAPEVEDWWLWHRSMNCYERWIISGYNSKGKAWVIWRYWDTLKVYLNFEPREPVCGIENFDSREGGYLEEYWFGMRDLRWTTADESLFCRTCFKYRRLKETFLNVERMEQRIIENSQS
jgi:hypothetical protein